MNKDQEIINWICYNSLRIKEILNPLIVKRNELIFETYTEFHDEVMDQYYDNAIKEIANEITKDLAIPIEMIYNIIEDKKLLIDKLANV